MGKLIWICEVKRKDRIRMSMYKYKEIYGWPNRREDQGMVCEMVWACPYKIISWYGFLNLKETIGLGWVCMRKSMFDPVEERIKESCLRWFGYVHISNKQHPYNVLDCCNFRACFDTSGVVEFWGEVLPTVKIFTAHHIWLTCK